MTRSQMVKAMHDAGVSLGTWGWHAQDDEIKKLWEECVPADRRAELEALAELEEIADGM